MAKHRGWDTEAAFWFWFNADGERRSYHDVSAEFHVSHSTVERAARADGWAERADEIMAEAREEANQRAIKTVAERNAEMLMLVDAHIAIYARRLIPAGPGAPNPHELTPSDLSPREFMELVKVAQLLQGQATDRHGEADRPPTIAELEAAIREDEQALAAWEAARAESDRTVALIDTTTPEEGPTE